MFAAVGVIIVSATGCRIEAHTQTQFEDNTQPAKTSTKDWNGESITINNDGVNPAEGTTGVEVKFSAAATKITVEATFSAFADDDKKSDADANIKDAISTLTLDESNGFNIHCGHGNGHGSSSQAGSGCKILRVTLPTSTAMKPHNITVGCGNGAIRVGLAEAGDAPFVKTLNVTNSGLGDVNVRATPVADAAITVSGDAVVALAVPGDFSSKTVTLNVKETDTAKAAARLKATDFTGFENGKSYPTSGPSATAAASISLTSTGPFADDTVSLTKF
jgi:hypothetical protein